MRRCRQWKGSVGDAVSRSEEELKDMQVFDWPGVVKEGDGVEGRGRVGFEVRGGKGFKTWT